MVVHADAFEWIRKQKDQSADLLIADPPYEIWDKHVDFVAEAVRVAENVLCFTQQPFDYKLRVASEPFFRRELIWTHTKSRRWVSHNLPLVSYHKIFWLSTKPKPYFNRRSGMPYSVNTKEGDKGYFVFEGFREKQRPYKKHEDGVHLSDCLIIDKPVHRKLNVRTKPQLLMNALVRCFCPDGGAVYDPFAGLGTVAVACKEQGKKYVGVELDGSLVKYIESIL